MKKYNVIMVFSPGYDKILMCRRRKEPYKGLSNLVGGKIEDGEMGMDAAYRELYEETGIGKKDIALTHLMDFSYPLSDCYLEVYAGKLKHEMAVQGDENELYWEDKSGDFFDEALYAGEGNIGHMMAQVEINKERLW